MPKSPRILAFGASNSRKSINKGFSEHAAQVFQDEFAPDAQIEILDLNDFEMPIYSIDREQADGIPALAQAFLDKIGAADGLIISFAVHNGTYTAAFKNIFDWASRIEKNIYQNKPMVILATSPGKGGGQSVLDVAITAAPHFAGDVKGSLSVGPHSAAFDAESGRLKDPEHIKTLREALGALHKVTAA